jgi:hypothetical protein
VLVVGGEDRCFLDITDGSGGLVDGGTEVVVDHFVRVVVGGLTAEPRGTPDPYGYQGGGARKQCLWRGNDNDRKRGGNLVAWEVVMKPKGKGGLGVLNLRLQNDALLMKHLNKFYNRAYIPWVNLVWSKYYTTKVPHAARE